VLKIPGRLLNDDVYSVSLYFVKDGSKVHFVMNELLTFEVVDEPRKNAWYGKWPGVVRPSLDFSVKAQ
jgi:lipopolysaccharide transport system ATP-binding protein